MRVATIDIGTNSVLLLVAEARDDGTLAPLAETAEITRLGEGVDVTRALAPRAIERTLAALQRAAELIRAHGALRVDAVGTSAMRDARGGEDFVARARSILGVAPRTIGGHEEARLTFEGSLAGLGLKGDVVVFDVGGGSTEVVHGRVPRAGAVEIVRAASIDVGSVRMTERLVRHDPPRPEELEAVRAATRSALADLPNPPAGATVVGIAGTVTTLAAVAREVDPYDAAKIHGARLDADEVRNVAARLAALPFAERRSVPGLHPKRADVIPAGGAIVEAMIAWSGARTVVVSDRGVRWGLALRLAAASRGEA